MRIFLLIESVWRKHCYPWVAGMCRGTVPGPPVDVEPWGHRPTLPANGAFSHIPSKSAFSDIMLVAGNRLLWEHLHHRILQIPRTSTAVYRHTSAHSSEMPRQPCVPPSLASSWGLPPAAVIKPLRGPSFRAGQQWAGPPSGSPSCSSFILLPHESVSKGKNPCPIKIAPRVLSPPYTLTAGLGNQGL